MKIKLPRSLETSRLVLKKHSLDPEYIQLWVDSINQNLDWLNQFLSHFNEPMTFDKEKSFLEGVITEEKEIAYGVWNKETNELLGSIGAFNLEENGKKSSVELGIMLFKKFAGKGYGPEATASLGNALLDAGIDNIRLRIDQRNTRSRRAAEKNGFAWDGQEKSVWEKRPDHQLLVYRRHQR